jgi:hypothetical protein
MHLVARLPAKREAAPAGVFGPKPVTVRAQAVPTSVAAGPDRAPYVGILRGVPSVPGTACIYRVGPGHAPKIWARGLSAVLAIASATGAGHPRARPPARAQPFCARIPRPGPGPRPPAPADPRAAGMAAPRPSR